MNIEKVSKLLNSSIQDDQRLGALLCTDRGWARRNLRARYCRENMLYKSSFETMEVHCQSKDWGILLGRAYIEYITPKKANEYEISSEEEKYFYHYDKEGI